MFALFILMLFGFTATVDKVEDNVVNVVFSDNKGSSMSVDMPSVIIPCDVSEGDVIYINKDSDVIQISCSEPVNTADVDIRIDPVTGKISYIIKGVKISL